MKTSELTGAALDWAVAKCEGIETELSKGGDVVFNARTTRHHAVNDYNTSTWQVFKPSTDWAQGGPIIEREEITVCWQGATWVASKFNVHVNGEYEFQIQGPTPLIAAMRCYVASKLSNEVEIPGELT